MFWSIWLPNKIYEVVLMKNMANCNFLVSILGTMIGVAIMNAASEFPLEFTENGPGPGFGPLL